MATTFISHAEETIDDVAQWGVDYVNRICDALMPDGRPFGMEKKSQRDQLREYLKMRGKPEAWTAWIEDKVFRIRTLLQESGIEEEEILSVHPYDIAEKFAFQFSYEMERLLSREEQRAREETLSPSSPSEVEDDDELRSREP